MYMLYIENGKDKPSENTEKNLKIIIKMFFSIIECKKSEKSFK
jgi:hypothetical protein